MRLTTRTGWLVVFSLALLAAPSLLEAQVCRRGKPCGNTCIARNRTCRVGPGTARAASPTTPPPQATASAPEGSTFVASSRGRVYYWIGCSAWRSLSPSNLRYFQTRAEAVAAGYRARAGARGLLVRRSRTYRRHLLLRGLPDPPQLRASSRT